MLYCQIKPEKKTETNYTITNRLITPFYLQKKIMTVMNYDLKLVYGNFWFIVPNLISSLISPSISEV